MNFGILKICSILLCILPHVYTILPSKTTVAEVKCKRVLAFFALQTTTVDGEQAAYLGESSGKYQEHLKVALTSIRQNCPSIVPVVVTMYPLPAATTAWIKKLGALVMTHELTFGKDVLKTAELPEFAWIKGVISTYLRTEVHLITEEFTEQYEAENVDLTYVIWGDLDTIWLKDFDSCTLAKPTILSVSGANTNDPNAGIGYYNTTAMSLIFDDMIAYARTKAFKFTALDNTLMAEFAGSKFTALPYFFNWRPYWGDVPKGQWMRDGGGEKYILHVHGPKLDKVKCILDYVVRQENEASVPWGENFKEAILKKCAMAHHQSMAMLSILEAAYAIDKGALYATTQKIYSTYLQKANQVIKKQKAPRYLVRIQN